MTLLVGCNGSTGSSNLADRSGKTAVDSSTPARIKVLATTSLIADAVRKIAGETVEIETLMGPGVDPHLYQPTARDPLRLRAAKLVLHHGLFLEGRLGVALEAASERTRVVAISKDIPPDQLLHHGAGEHSVDPHVWLDAKLWSRCVATIGAALAEVDATNRDVYAQGVERAVKELEQLDEECRLALAKIPVQRRVLITSHDAFGYFGRAYEVEVVGIQGLSTETEAGLKRITETVDLIRSRGIRGVFPETSVPKTAIERVSRDAGAKLGHELYSDSLGPIDETAGTYVGMMRENVRRIVAGLGGTDE